MRLCYIQYRYRVILLLNIIQYSKIYLVYYNVFKNIFLYNFQTKWNDIFYCYSFLRQIMKLKMYMLSFKKVNNLNSIIKIKK